MMKLMFMGLPATFLAAMLSVTTASADSATAKREAAQEVTSPVGPSIGGPCDTEGHVEVVQSIGGLIECVNGKWAQVGAAVAESARAKHYYDGPCSVRVREKQLNGKRALIYTLVTSHLADVCLPTGWHPAVVAEDGMQSWDVDHTDTIPNLILVRPKLWQHSGPPTGRLTMYPTDGKGQMHAKVVVNFVKAPA